MGNSELLTLLRSANIRKIFTDNHVNQAYLIGSFARGDATETSDIDIMYTRPSGGVFTLFNIGNMKSRLEAESGRSVDLVSESSIRRGLREQVEKNKTPLFETYAR